MRVLLAVAVVAATFACGDSPAPTAPDSRISSGPDRATIPGAVPARVAVVGLLEEVRGSTLVLRQEGPTVPAGTPPGRVELPLGQVGDRIEVRTDAATEVYVAGARGTLQALVTGSRIIAAGQGSGLTLTATRLSDLGAHAAPTDADRTALRSRLDTTSRSERAVSTAALAAAALCSSQDFDYDEDVDEFQGCWGGPSVIGSYDNPDVPLSCGLLGCFVLERVSYSLALAGWSFAFPYRFSAVGDLVYHVPGTVTLGLEALPATTGAFTFGGGLGVDFGFTVSYCWIVGGCDALGTYHISPFSTAHQATDEAPFSGEVMPIAETGCPSIPVGTIIPGLLAVLSLGLCEDLSLEGAPFSTTIWMRDASPPTSTATAFDGASQQLTLRPNARTATVEFDSFEYIPTLTMDFYFRVKLLGVKLFDTPSIPLTDGPFEAITTPFPREGSAFSENVPQPTLRTIVLEVDPAPTRLTVVSPAALAEGMPVRVRLAEAYDDSPIAGATVAFTATGEGEVITRTGTTGTDGVAEFPLDNGEYLVRAAFGGSDVYLPSQSMERQVFVYQPTTFVIWGGNAEGVQVGARYQFWGSDWWRTITTGDVRGLASFKGFATQVTGSEWVSGPGASGPPPKSVGRLIGVIVTTRVNGEGNRVGGDIADWVVLRVEDRAAYAPAPGHPAYGVMRRRVAEEPR